MTENDIIPHLFRKEYSKIVSVLTKSFGLENIEIAEDITSESFLSALDTWPYKGTPANPTAWLYTVAKNKAKNHLTKLNNFKTKVAEKRDSDSQFDEINLDFSANNIADSQLQMLFSICHPSISTKAQICLALRVLCGFGLNEIADAFLSNTETIHKRLQRAKQKLKSEMLPIGMPESNEIKERLDTVLHTIYLLFSEGYYSESNPAIIREELCIEALNLTYLLIDNSLTNTHSTNSLMSLMCFHSSRLKARKSENGNIILYDDQDKKLWDQEFVEKGFYYLQQASQWDIGSKYYIEASIAYWHTVDKHPDKWPSILKLYEALNSVDKSPIVSLNSLWAYSKVYGIQSSIKKAENLNLKTNHFYFLLLAEFYKQVDMDKSFENYQRAFDLCKTESEKLIIKKQLDGLVFEND